MNTPSVRTDTPPGQALVPDHMRMIQPEWRTDDSVSMELYVDLSVGVGRLIAVEPEKSAVIAAYIADADGVFSAAWTGEIDRPDTWKEAQRATAHARYARRKGAA